MAPSITLRGPERERSNILMRSVVDGTFQAIATILHRVPREIWGHGIPCPQNRSREPGTLGRDVPDSRSDRDSNLRDLADGWIRVAL